MKTCDMCPAFIHTEESLRTGRCHGCRSPKAEFLVSGCTLPKAEAGGLSDDELLDMCGELEDWLQRYGDPFSGNDWTVMQIIRWARQLYSRVLRGQA